MKRLAKSAVMLCVLGLLPVSTAAPAVADIINGLEHKNSVRVSNRSFSGHTVCVYLDNVYVNSQGPVKASQDCRKIGVRRKFTWYYDYYDKHPKISVVVESDKRVFPFSFPSDKVARDLCFRFSASGSFHEAKDCDM
ncbi:hypothetical protein [Amycolatopsis sp. NPDC059657]|uniref:hypothetical protein n=1 Tax=Amycolatopsis sp. NPDC059657 TaxID=3346899 RepID=UPI00366B138B